MSLRPTRRVMRFRMPRLVDGIALEWVADRMVLLAADERVVLDFKNSIYLDYRALRKFAKRLERRGRVAEPITLAEMRPFVNDVVRFALTGTQWDWFVEERREEERTSAEKGNLRTEASLARGSRMNETRAPFRGLLVPHPN